MRTQGVSARNVNNSNDVRNDISLVKVILLNEIFKVDGMSNWLVPITR